MIHRADHIKQCRVGMKGKLTGILITLVFLQGLMLAADSLENEAWLRSLPEPWLLTEPEISGLLPLFHQRYPEFQDRFVAVLKWRTGTPYGLFKFGEEAPPDTDPIIRLDSSDCTSHILSNLAISQATDWDNAREKMIRIHYKPAADGSHEANYSSRWHYTLDRVMHNPFTVDITGQVAGPELLTDTVIVLNRKIDGSNFLPISWEQETPLRYIRSEHVTQDLLSALPDLAGIAFVKESYFRMGIAVAHEGILLDGKELIHASSEYSRTVAVDFLKYFHREDGPLFDGILVYGLNPINN